MEATKMTLSKRESPIFQGAMFRFYVKPWQGIIIFLSPGLGWIYSSYTYDCYDHRTSTKNCDRTFSHALWMRWMVGWGARCKSLSGRRVKSCQTRAIKSIKTPSWKKWSWHQQMNQILQPIFCPVILARRTNFHISTWIRPSFWSSSGTNDSKSQEQGPLPVSSCAQTCRGPTCSIQNIDIGSSPVHPKLAYLGLEVNRSVLFSDGRVSFCVYPILSPPDPFPVEAHWN